MNQQTLNIYIKKNFFYLENINFLTNLNNFMIKLIIIILESIQLFIPIIKLSLYNKNDKQKTYYYYIKIIYIFKIKLKNTIETNTLKMYFYS